MKDNSSHKTDYTYKPFTNSLTCWKYSIGRFMNESQERIKYFQHNV